VPSLVRGVRARNDARTFINTKVSNTTPAAQIPNHKRHVFYKKKTDILQSHESQICIDSYDAFLSSNTNLTNRNI